MSTENTSNPVDNSSPVDKPKDSDNSEDTVKYSTFKKLLDEKKALSSKHSDTLAKLAEYEAKEKAESEKKLLDEKNFQKLIETRDNELNSLKESLAASKSNEINFRKVYSFINALGDSKIESKYYSLIPLDSIRVNDETGDIDKDSLTEVVNNFKTEHTRLLITPKRTLPEGKTGSSSGKGLSLNDWKSLKSSKEMMEKFKEVDFTSP